MEFTTEEQGGVAIARLKGVLDSAGVVRMQEGVENLLTGRERKVVLDFSEIDALDPMGLAELLRLSRWVKEGGLRLRVAHAAPHVEEAFRDNMISDVEFFRDVNAASRFTVEAPPPQRLAGLAPASDPVPAPRPGRPKKSFLVRYWWLFAGIGLIVALVVAAVLAAGKFADEKVEFLTVDAQPWSGEMRESLKPGEEKILKFQVRNADQIMSIRNEDWIEMRDEPGPGENARTVIFRLFPEKDFSPTDTYFYVTSGDGKPRLRSPTIYLISDAKAMLPKFDLSNREFEESTGEEGGRVMLSPGTEGEQYGPDGIFATGGAKLSYTASGHEPYGLKFDAVTGRFSGEAQRPTPNGEYVPITIVARNDVGEKSITAMLQINKKKEIETPAQAANVFGEEIRSRFELLDLRSLDTPNIRMLMDYKDVILKQGEGDIHKAGPVFFPKGIMKLPVEAQRRLDVDFEANGFRELAADPKTFFFVLGFADKGKNTADAINKRLIKDRAEKLKDYLVQHLAARHKLSAAEIAERVKVIPMLPVPDDVETGEPVIFKSREHSRAGEIWLVKDPR